MSHSLKAYPTSEGVYRSRQQYLDVFTKWLFLRSMKVPRWQCHAFVSSGHRRDCDVPAIRRGRPRIRAPGRMLCSSMRPCRW